MGKAIKKIAKKTAKKISKRAAAANIKKAGEEMRKKKTRELKANSPKPEPAAITPTDPADAYLIELFRKFREKDYLESLSKTELVLCKKLAAHETTLNGLVQEADKVAEQVRELSMQQERYRTDITMQGSAAQTIKESLKALWIASQA